MVNLVAHLKIKIDACSSSCIAPYHWTVKLQLVLKSIPELNGFLRCGRAGSLLYLLLRTCAAPLFYSDLFTAVPTDPLVRSSLLSNLSSSLSRDQARHFEGFLTPEECLGALKGVARNKAPGLDGFPAEFYLKV